MAKRSLSDVPNRVIRIFLESAGEEYDRARHLDPFRGLTEDLRNQFGNVCASCGLLKETLLEEHVTPINREFLGLHAWGNVVPACTTCNKAKAHHPWPDCLEHMQLDRAQVARARSEIDAFRRKYRYAPNLEELGRVTTHLYRLVDAQTRGLIAFSVEASRSAFATLPGKAPGDG